MKQVWKFALEPDETGRCLVELPWHSRVLCVQLQVGRPHIWVLVEPLTTAKQTFAFYIIGTGHPVPDLQLDYLGTFQLANGALIYHVFRDINAIVVKPAADKRPETDDDVT